MTTFWKTLSVLAAAAVLASACGGGEGNSRDDEVADVKGPTFTKTEDGKTIRKFDIDGDGSVDVIKHFKPVPDPEDPAVTRQVMFEKEVDVNSDGTINIRREYSDQQQLTVETADLDLDGTMDVVNHFDGGTLVKKEVLVGAEDRVAAYRYYADGQIDRVEKDTNDDGKIDYWEYYEKGVLDRIGRDLNADGRADTWQTR